jgi:hypothetical protein
LRRLRRGCWIGNDKEELLNARGFLIKKLDGE